MKTFSRVINNLDELNGFLTKDDLCIEYQNSDAILVQIFSASSEESWLNTLLEKIEQQCPKATVIGTTTAGEINHGQTIADATVISVSCFKNTRLKSFVVNGHETSAREAGKTLCQTLNSLDGPVAGALLLGTTITLDMAQVFDGMSGLDENIAVFGGGAGIYDIGDESKILHQRETLDCGVVAVAFIGSDLSIDTQTYLGWIPLSKEMTITEVDHMTVKRVDHEPAYEIYRRYLGIPADDDFYFNALEFPFLISRNNELLARIPVSVDDAGALQFVADIKEGEKFRIGYGNPDLIIEHSEKIVDRLRQQSPESIFLYSCGCRRFLMQEGIAQETEPFEAIAPTTGFYTYGEFFRGHAADISLLNSTLVAVMMREGPAPATPSTKQADTHSSSSSDPYANQHNRVISKLTHFISEVTKELEQAHEEAMIQATTDQLTGLCNRRKIEQLLEDQIEQAKQSGQPFSVAMVDIDYFKQLNDAFGHHIGDQVLKGIADTLRQRIRTQDSIGRWGGEEFLIVFPQTDLDEAVRLSEALRQVISALNFPDIGNKTASFGVTQFKLEDDSTSLVCRADNALYEAKSSGRNCIITQ
ncbi:MAG: GGDEF domain-containing protein [Hydrogenovibrio sp.]|nr:GGDEF domain-containing protein [Hydrogenovibrio sp.]